MSTNWKVAMVIVVTNKRRDMFTDCKRRPISILPVLGDLVNEMSFLFQRAFSLYSNR